MKLREFQAELRDKKIDAALISSKDKNFKYFNGFDDFYGVLVVSKKDAFIITNLLEIKRARIKSRIKKVIVAGKDFAGVVRKRINRISVIGINKDDVSMNRHRKLRSEFKNSKFVDISKMLYRLREIKTDEEIRIIKDACKISDSIFRRVRDYLSSKRTEKDVINFIEKEISRHGCEEAFPIIVASSRNSNDIHHVATESRLKGFTIIDLGVIYKNYCTDSTRTFYVGKPSKKEIHDFNKILGIINGIKKPGDLKNAKILKSQKHALGHSIGIEVHEKPTVGKGTRIRENMVFALEPGMYGKGYGIRIEDLLLARGNKLINLTNYPKDLIIIRK